MTFDHELWDRISMLSFDQPAAKFCFADRLARDNGWTRAFADRVIAEYRRFAYLAVTAGHEVTPSDEVDQAWHLHLTYTRHYWGPFTQALGQQLHHGPTIGGPVERNRYANNYANTLSSYRAAFHASPPVDIWPVAEKRFGDAPFMQRVNLRKIYPATQSKRRTTASPISIAKIGGAIACGALGAIAFVGATAAGADLDIAGAVGEKKYKLAFVALVGLMLLIGLFGISRSIGATKKSKSNSDGGAVVPFGGGDSNGGDGGSGCSGGGGCGGGCGGG